MPDAAWWAVTIDCNDPQKVAGFWSALFGCPIIEPGPDRRGWLRLKPLGPNAPFINLQPVDDATHGKVRLHLDVLVEDMPSAIERVIGLGGSDTGGREELPRGRIAVMRDPEGNEFCLLSAPARPGSG